MKNGKRGGARPGAGRPTIAKKEVSLHVKVSKKEADILTFYSKAVGLNKSEIVNMLLSGLNHDVVCCSECHTPIAYRPSYLLDETIKKQACPKCGALVSEIAKAPDKERDGRKSEILAL